MTPEPALSKPVPLLKNHDLTIFDCGAFDFESSPIDELHLYLLIKDIQANLSLGP